MIDKFENWLFRVKPLTFFTISAKPFMNKAFFIRAAVNNAHQETRLMIACVDNVEPIRDAAVGKSDFYWPAAASLNKVNHAASPSPSKSVADIFPLDAIKIRRIRATEPSLSPLITRDN